MRNHTRMDAKISVSTQDGHVVCYDQITGVIADDMLALERYVQKNNLGGFIDMPQPNEDETQGFVFVLTTKCNLNCSYCYSITQNKPLSMRQGDTIHILKNNIRDDARYIFINFFGGEPTLEMDIIRETVEWLKKTIADKTVYFRVSTNGLVRLEDLDYLIDNKFYIGVSSDGIVDSESHLIKRRVAQQVEQTLLHLVKRNAIFNVRCTVTDRNYIQLPDFIRYWHSLGITMAHIEPYHPIGVSEDEIQMLPPQKEFLDSFKNAIELASELGMWIYTGAYMNLLTPSSYFCTGASGRFKVYNPDGSISTCYRVQSFDTVHSNFIIGNWRSFIVNEAWENNRKRLHEHDIDTIDSCSICKVRFACSGGCLMRNYTQSGVITEPDKWICNVKKELCTDAIIRIWKAIEKKEKPIVLGRFVFEDKVIKHPAIDNRGMIQVENRILKIPTDGHAFDVFESIGMDRNDKDTIFNRKIARSECI